MKERLDTLLVLQGYAQDLRKARALIGAGLVLVNNEPADKAGVCYADSCGIVLKKQRQFVSRGGEKLAAGLNAFKVAPTDWVCADIGCSTGGFTDCLLQRGARRIYAVDVGYGILDWSLRQDQRVVVLERTNARALSRKDIPEPLELAVIDASFISLKVLLAPLQSLFGADIRIIALVKPQFELPRELVPAGGVVTDSALHQKAVDMISEYGHALALEVAGVEPSPVLGAKGNREFLLYLVSYRDEK